MGLFSGIWDTVKGIAGGVGDAMTGGLYSAAGNAVSGLIDKWTGNDTTSQQSKILEKQKELEQENALWNFENITKPTAEMENAEWDRRFGAQNEEWERQWNMQNKYNSPAEQIQRLREAGINPAGINPAQMTGTAGDGMTGNPSVNEYASTPARAANAADAYQASSADRLTEAKARNMEAENRQKEAEVRKKEVETKYYGAYMEGLLKLQDAEIGLKGAESELKKGQANEVKKNIEYVDQLIAESLTKMQETYQRISTLIAEARNLNVNADDLEKTREPRIKKIYSAIAEDYASAAQAYAAARELDQLAQNLATQNKLDKIELNFQSAMLKYRKNAAREGYKYEKGKFELGQREIKYQNETFDWRNDKLIDIIGLSFQNAQMVANGLLMPLDYMLDRAAKAAGIIGRIPTSGGGNQNQYSNPYSGYGYTSTASPSYRP